MVGHAAALRNANTIAAYCHRHVVYPVLCFSGLSSCNKNTVLNLNFNFTRIFNLEIKERNSTRLLRHPTKLFLPTKYLKVWRG